MAAGEFIHHVKRMRALETGNIMCSSEDCVGVVPAALDDLPQPVACQVCSKQNCARRTCGVPWTEGHRCWDVVAREQQQEAERIERMEELRREERRALAEWDMRHGRALPEDPTYIIQNRIASGPKVQPCPTCGVMVEHNGGCNMMYQRVAVPSGASSALVWDSARTTGADQLNPCCRKAHGTRVI
eukprot:CAMPEP_0170638400 /NCGR_PEP_ID=MMETSP0224-20130122/39009_1 /TAXON_ID=285029 /ORGANISM="Togula jolla, Strain CCCM 725" /LENGTH=185 /DNA_ID=CAMNT_0010968513 /DNA_START=414 /DNA_END=975 /DNA_ORIENTATION=-